MTPHIPSIYSKAALRSCFFFVPSPTSLDLNDIIKTTIRTELRKFGKEHPNCKFNIICDLDEEATDTINEINEYLVENQCPERLKTGGQIIMKDRTTFFRYTKKEVL